MQSLTLSTFAILVTFVTLVTFTSLVTHLCHLCHRCHLCLFTPLSTAFSKLVCLRLLNITSLSAALQQVDIWSVKCLSERMLMKGFENSVGDAEVLTTMTGVDCASY